MVTKSTKQNPHAVALGALGASKGGRARAASLSARRRKQIARRAAQARWARVRAAQQAEDAAQA